jgi:hypothetical protein
MQLDISRIRKIKEETSNIFSIINKPRLYSDYDRYYFLCEEFDTLICILNLLELRAYKESFVLLRTVFEKFLYFWLMLEGKRYRWTVTYNIQPIVSKAPKEARDNTIEHSYAEMKSGNPKLKDVIQIQAGSADQEMNLTFESEGLYERDDVSHGGPLIPIYNFILREYQPDFVHVPPIEKLKEGTVPSETLLEQIKLQKRFYHNFIYIDSILRNLLINSLITKVQKNRINVHYNFLSKFVHPGFSSIEVWQNLNPESSSNSMLTEYDEEILRELIFLYVSRLMYLYLKVFVQHFKGEANFTDYPKYILLLEELDGLSRDLWFFDDEPTEFDKRQYIRNETDEEMKSEIPYYDDPLRRLQIMRNFIHE